MKENGNEGNECFVEKKWQVFYREKQSVHACWKPLFDDSTIFV